MASRPVEEAALNEFLDAAASAPAALLVDGEAGIGKTTLWVAGLQRARDRGFRVLSARTAQANSVLAYASLADLLTGVEPDAWADLPEPQRIAVDRVLLRERAADAVPRPACGGSRIPVGRRSARRRRPSAARDRRPAMARSVDRSRDRIHCAATVRSGGPFGHCPHRARQRRRHLVAAIAPTRCHPPNRSASVVF